MRFTETPSTAAASDGLPTSQEHWSPHEPQKFEQALADLLARDLTVLVASIAEDGALAAATACFALVDRGLCVGSLPCDSPQHPIALAVRQHGLPFVRLFEGTPEDALADQGPWLIALPRVPDAILLQTLARHAGVHHALSLLVSTLPLPELTRHLRKWTEAVIPADAGLSDDEAHGAVLRWFDPRIGFDMLACWPEAERKQFLQAIRSWIGWTVDYSIRVVHGQCDNTSAPRNAALILDKPLLLALDRLGTAEALLAAIRENDIAPGELDHIAPALQRWLAHRLLDKGRQLGIEDWPDLHMMLALGLRVHPEVADFPTLQPILARAATGAQALGAGIAALDPNWVDSPLKDAARAIARLADVLLMAARHSAQVDCARHPLALPLPHQQHGFFPR